MPLINKYRVYCQTEAAYVYGWYQTAPTVCPNNNTHTIDLNATVIVDILDSVGDFDTLGRLTVNTGQYTQFGDQRVSTYNPLFQNYSLYNIINPQIYNTELVSGGTITGNTNGTELNINITSTNGSSAILKCIKVCKYRPGYNLVIRWNTLYTTPVANLLQFSGLRNIGSDIYFCYNGLDFGIRYSTGGYSEIRTFTVNTAENSTRTAVVTLNGVAFNVSLITAGGNTSFTAYQISRTVFTGWLVTAVANVVYFSSTTPGSKNGTYSYSAGGGVSAGTFTQLRAGANLTTTFVNRLDWNGPSSMVQDLNPLNRNMYCINYSWYGSGNITFQVYNPTTSVYETVHTISFANTSTEPSFSHPNMYLQQGLISQGSTTAATIRVAGGFGAVEGQYSVKFPIYGVFNTRAIAANVENVLLVLKNRNEMNSFINNSEILIRSINADTNGNGSVLLRIIKNPTTISGNTTTNFINYQFVDTNSIMLVDKIATTYTGGTVVASYYLARSGNQNIDLLNQEITMFKEDVIIITALSVNNNTMSIGVSVVEDY